MKKSDGILSLKKAAKLLNKHAPEGESLAYINPEEARLLKSHGGSGIMTLAGVPTYGLSDWWDTIKEYGKKATDWLGYTGGDGGGQQLMKDIASMWGGYEGMKESKELSEWEKQQYAEQKAKEELNTALFAGQTDSGAQLLAPQNVPADTTAVSAYRPIDFSGSATPDLTTTAVAQGGRIGYGIGSLPINSQPQGEESIKMAGTDTPILELEDLPKLLDDFYEIFGRSPTSIDELKSWAANRTTEAPEEVVEEQVVEANTGGLMRTGYALGSEHPIIPSKDGQQLDMRDAGGYQPHGKAEKHDDVRALLAQGEFVMTSDAVKGMGGGDRELGAQKMYNLMHSMEAMA